MGTPARARSGPPRAGGPAPGPPGPGGPRGPPGRGPPGDPRGPLRDPHFGAQPGQYIIILLTKGGPQGGPQGGAPGGAPGGQKSAHFFGYLITLPVGTKIWDFSTPRDGAKMGGLGGIWGVSDWDSVYSTAGTAICLGLVP